MQIDCPCCGLRNQDEFHYGGQAHIVRPTDPSQVDHEAWAQYQFTRINPLGEHRERWQHLYGCGLWFHLVRDTKTHEISAVYGINDNPPEDVT